MFKNILIPTDGSRPSEKAVKHGVALAKLVGARVTGFFAAPPATPIVYRDILPVGFAQPPQHAQMIERTAARYLDFIARAAKNAGVPFEAVKTTSDYPGDSILATAKKKRCDLIVMATHGRRGVRGMLLGSETQKVLAQSKIPVLVVR